MGNDYGGRKKTEPGNCPKVICKNVFAFAKAKNIRVKWGGPSVVESGTWWFWSVKNVWLTAGVTNFLYLEFLKRLPPNECGDPSTAPDLES
jgi:hypothetical protein